MASRYALKYPDRVQHLILVGPAGFAEESVKMAQFRSTWKGTVANFFWERDIRPQLLIRASGRLGPRVVEGYTSTRFGARAQGLLLSPEEAPLFTDYTYHTLVAPSSGEFCLKHIFSLGAFARAPLLDSAKDWKVPTTFCYGVQDWMDYEAGREAARQMPVPAQVLRLEKAGHFAFLDNAPGFYAAVVHSCRHLLPYKGKDLPKDLVNNFITVPLEDPVKPSSSEDLKTSEKKLSSIPVSFEAGQKFAETWKIG